jgi:uncharacterized membrane protein YkvA (DUF1232 family)
MSTDQHAPREVESGVDPTVRADFNDASTAQVEFGPLWDLIKRLPTYVRLSAAMARDPRVPKAAKASLAIGGIYVVSPIDLIPGLIPIAGQLDDLYVVLTGLQQAMRLSPGPVVEEHLADVGLSPTSIDDDLATLRTFVRQGLAWTFQQGGKVVATASRQSRSLIHRARAWGSTRT